MLSSSTSFSKVQVWVYRRTELHGRQDVHFLILLTNSARGSFWQPVTGGVEEGESLTQAALREAKEETGLNFSSPSLALPRPIGEPFSFETRGKKATEFAFAIEAPAIGEAVILDPMEHVQYRWVRKSDALQMLRYPSNTKILELLAQDLGCSGD